MAEELQLYQARLAELVADREKVWERARKEFDTIDAEERQRRDGVQARRQQLQGAIDAQIAGLYKLATGGIEIKSGDVIRIALTRGDAKKGEYGIVESLYDDSDYGIPMIVFEMVGGHVSIPVDNVYLVLDPDEANKFRLKKLIAYLDYSRGDDLLRQLQQVKGLTDCWITHLAAGISDCSDAEAT